VKLRIIKIGRIAYPEIKSLASMYAERLTPFAKVESHEIKDDLSLTRLLPKSPSEHPIIALDERGQQWTSRELAGRLRNFTDDPAIKSLSFLVGGPMGLSEEVRASARLKLSLSKATLTSDMAWLLLWEQLYRAYNILHGTGYHHD
jgi:23S rRNA (pseudouridine1915-N3)-methyltransferase